MEQDQPVPESLSFNRHIMEILFHPTHDIIAAGLVNGRVEIHKYASDGSENQQLHALNHHRRASCRALLFSDDGRFLFTGSTDRTLQAVDVESGQVMLRQAQAHREPINLLHRINDHMIVSGCDGGTVNFWDLRSRTVVSSLEVASDFISDAVFNETHSTLVTTSGDGTLSAIDTSQRKLIATSSQMDDELLSIQMVRDGRRLAVGTQSGVINIWDWGLWGDHIDRFPGHPESVDTMVPVTSNLLLTGSSDGLIRVVSVHPNKLLGVVGSHEDFPIERLRVDRHGSLLASASHDQTIRFWGVDFLRTDGGSAAGEFDDSNLNPNFQLEDECMSVSDEMSCDDDGDDSDSDSDDAEFANGVVGQPLSAPSLATVSKRMKSRQGKGFFGGL
ncbi:hypothetical protein H696_01235 [Fonticula alba]|uniref:Uncharacterized protein n=1 Tax=Fonticula alba TaxID=691883 RepID=A0A058ZED5_FONAL|nr:hypothetical protein H696_01235 [Fonticula alba]KCV71817.1 hypothetical protein H696_01235 [Fonticula alba]|eukprot:XP_009493395.1 hypothetical protein H696_01235 [Fonticula alba]